ncbi:MAG TPA: SpoIIIAH-like family protein [Clostridiaceae bacterium]|nr:SpoIIIAH-like family protein [Clostridiaceae bacterium]
MTVIKRRQIIILALVVMIVVAGYIQYSYKKSGFSQTDSDAGKLGEAVYVDNQDFLESVNLEGQAKDKDKSVEKVVTASKEAEDYFAQTKLEKEITRSKDVDNFRSIAEDEKASAEVQEEAYSKMMTLIDSSDREMRIEALIKKQGFDDVIALFADNGSVDIIVKVPNLTASQVAQIMDIVNRQANVEIENIIVKNKF